MSHALNSQEQKDLEENYKSVTAVYQGMTGTQLSTEFRKSIKSLEKV